ncbi:MAG: response regulator [Desulfobulbaceae bacterium]|nr:response regulator [Desulfobulbaceae bacterium]
MKNDLNDISLLDLFLMETVSQCLNLSHELDKWDNAPGAGPDFNAMHRAIHSITGAARIVDLQAIINLARAMEHSLPIAAAKPSSETYTLLQSAVDLLNQLVKVSASQIKDTLHEKKNLISNISTHLLELKASPSSVLPETSSAPPVVHIPTALASQGLFHIFREDAENHLAVLSDNLIQIEKNPRSGVLLESSMRAVHSLKGAARIIELDAIVTLAHAMEDIFIAAENGTLSLTPEHIDTLFTAADAIKDLTKQDEENLPSWFADNNKTIFALAEKLLHTEKNSAECSVEAGSLTQPSEAPQAVSNEPEEPQNLSATLHHNRPGPNNMDRLLRVSSQGMSQILALASEAMIESRWLPTITSTITRVKRQQDEVWYSLEKIRAQLAGSGIPPALDSGLADIVAKLKRNQDYFGHQIIELTEHSTHAVTIGHRLHQEILRNRMQPLSEGVIGLPRLVRDLARQQNKTVRFEIIGSETMIDRDILEKLESPFNHLITNAIDHGIEPSAQREKIGKPREASLTLTACHHAGMLVITISDDGRGLNYETLRKKAVERRLVSEKVAAELTETELSEFLFLPNFTTKDSADKTSGRGVGLDIVYNTIREIRGEINLHSIPGQGLTFELHLPLTLSTIRGLLMEINNEPYALPLINIDHAVRLPRNEIKEMGTRQYFITNNKRVGLITAQQALDLKEQEQDDDTLSIIVLGGTSNNYGLIVDRFQGIRDLVVQPLNPRLGKLRSISAAAIGEDGTPILILDINDLRQSMDRLISGERLQRIEPQIISSHSKRKRILAVDDSITVREVERKILTEHGFEVEVAVDGFEAWNMIRLNRYDLIITDIDMPNMDGIELLIHIKEAADYENIPVIILSYKDREEDRVRGLDAGADYYLTKSSFHNLALIEAVEDLIGPPSTSPINENGQRWDNSSLAEDTLRPSHLTDPPLLKGVNVTSSRSRI